MTPTTHSRRRRSAAPLPDRFRGLHDLAVAAEQHEAVERTGEPAVVGHRDHRAVEARAAPPPAPRRWPGRGCPSARRAAAASRRTAPAAAPGTGPAARRRGCRSAGRPAPASSYRDSAGIACGRGRPVRRSSPRQRISTRVRSSRSGRSWVCEKCPGRTRAPSRDRAAVRDRRERRAVDRRLRRVRVGAAAGQQPQEVRLAGAVARRGPRPGRRTRSPGRTGRSGSPAPAARR